MGFASGAAVCLFGGILPIAAAIALFVNYNRLHGEPGSDQRVKDEVLNLAIALIVLGFMGFVLGVMFFMSKGKVCPGQAPLRERFHGLY